MNRDGYANEGMDIKKYMLCLLKCLPALLGAVIGGALIGVIVYTVARTVPESEREYQAFAKLQLDFAVDGTGEAYQAYNGYTWNDLMATDPIMNLTLQSLSSDFTREEVEQALRAEILSDIRILTVTVTTHSSDRTDAILMAAVEALERYGSQTKEFWESRRSKPHRRSLWWRTAGWRRPFCGGFARLLIALFGISFYYMMDDRIFVAGDARKVTDAPFLGYASGTEVFKQDYERNLVYLQEKWGGLFVCEIEKEKPLTKEDFKPCGRLAAWCFLCPLAVCTRPLYRISLSS